MIRYFATATLLMLCACQNEMKPLDYHLVFQNLRWLEGSWQGSFEGKPFCESWAFANDTLMVNKNLDCAADTIAEDGARIQVIDKQVFYTNAPKAGEQLLTWKLADCSPTRVRFANPNAPYSQTIVFEKTADGKWTADLTTKGKTLTHVLTKK